MAGTGIGSIYFREDDANGQPLSGGLLYTYEAGTSTPLKTYNNPDLAPAHENTNPVELDAAGRALIFLQARAYRFVLTDANGVGIYDVPSYSAYQGVGGASGVDITVTFGESVIDADWVVISDGSGGRTAGRWYRGDADDPNISTVPGRIGFAVGAFSAGDVGFVRIEGTKDGFTGLSSGQLYYGSGTVGGITLTRPTNARTVAAALSATTVVIIPSGPVSSVPVGHVVNGVLTLVTGVAYPPTDQTGKASVFFTPYKGNVVRLYDGTQWNTRTFSELTLALGTITAARAYDVFIYDNAGTPTLEMSAAWNSASAGTRFAAGPYASLLPKQDGVFVKSTNGTVIDATRMYLGTFYTTATTTTEDSAAKRFLWNYYNREERFCQSPLETTDNWTYTVLTWRQARATATNQFEFVVGVAETTLKATCSGIVGTDGSSAITNLGIGFDSTSALASGCLTGHTTAGNSQRWQCIATYAASPAIGVHSVVWLESSGVAGVTTWYGDNGNAPFFQAGISGSLQ